jgi:4-amino-4-deoxy-L-arabinose transferase-like glycosyltransferase
MFWRHPLGWALLIGLLALALRTVTLGWGLPYVEHPDEPFYVEIIVQMVRDGNPNPLSFWHPPLLFYLLSLVTRSYAAWAIAQGTLGSIADLPIKTYFYTTDPTLYLWNRAAVGFLGALTVLLLFQLGWRMFNLRTAICAALLLAVARFHIEHSYYIATSAPTGLFVTLVIAGAWGVATTGRLRDYLLLGVAAGLAAATKYNAGPVGLVVLVAHAIYWRNTALRTSWLVVLSGFAAGAGFLIGNPFALLDWPRFRADLATQSAAYSAESGDFVGVGNLGGYLAFLWQSGIGWPGSLIFLAGLPLLLRHSWRQVALLSTPIIILLALLLIYPTHFVRNLLLVYPALLLLVAVAAVALSDWLRTQITQRKPSTDAAPWLAPALLALLMFGILVPQLRSTGWLLRYWSQPHTLAQAADLLREQPRGMLAAVELNPVQWAGDPVITPLPFLGTYPPEWYRARGFRFLVLNDERYDPRDQPVYDRLMAGGTVLLEMPPRRAGLQPGPGGAVIDLGEHLDQIPFVRQPARFGEITELLGYELQPGEPRTRITPLEGADQRRVPPGTPLQINLYWRALAATEIDYVLFVHVYDANDQRVAQRDLPLRYNEYPTSQWQPGELVIERADLPLPALPPGRYRLLIGLYDPANGAALTPAPVELTTIDVE